MPRLALLIAALAALAALPACQGSDPQPLELLSRDPSTGRDSVIGGGGNSSMIGYTILNGGVASTVRLVRHDVTSADQFTMVGDVGLEPNVAVTRLVVTDQVAAAIADWRLSLVDLTSPSLPVQVISIPGGAQDVAVSGRWVLVVAGNDLTLINRDTPLSSTTYTSGSAPTGILATQGMFLAFTTTGYVMVDPSRPTPTFQPVADTDLRDIRDAYADGVGAIVAGPASTLSRSKVLLLDLTSPTAPVVAKRHEVAGGYATFAWDGASTFVVAIDSHQGYLVTEDADGFHDFGIPLPTWYYGGHPLAAHSGHLFALDPYGMLFFRLR